MDKIHDSVAWYQKKIGLHDKQLWEQTVDRKVLTGIRNAPRRSVRAKTEFIDIDLVRGSTFTRAKPQVSWTYIVHKAISRVIFFPFHYKWWLQQTSTKCFVFLLLLYVSQLIATVLFCQNIGAILQQDEIILSEVFIPLGLMLLLGYIHSQAVLSHSHFSHRSQRDIKSMREYQERRKRHDQRKKLSPSTSSLVCDKSSKTSSDADRKSPNIDRRPKRVVKNKDFISKSTKKNGGMESKSVSWSDAFHEELSKTVPDMTLRNQECQDIESSTDEETGILCSLREKAVASNFEKLKGFKRETTVEQCEGSQIQQKLEFKKETSNIPETVINPIKFEANAEFGTKERECPAKEEKNNCDNHPASKIDILSTDVQHTGENYDPSIDGLTVSHCTDGIILQTENLDNEQAQKFLRQSSESLSSLASSSSNLEESKLKNAISCKRKVEGYLDRKSVNPLEKNPSDQDRNPLEQLYAVRHSENLSEDSGIDQSNKTLNSRAKMRPLASLVLPKPKKEVTSDTDPERNNSGSESEKESHMKAKNAVLKGLRRRSQTLGDESSESGAYYRVKRNIWNKDKKDLSSSEGETSLASGHKVTMSSEEHEEWEDRVQSDDTTSTYSSDSDVELNEPAQVPASSTLNSSSSNQIPGDNVNVINLLQPPTSSSALGGHHYVPPDKVSCVIWESGECQKVDLTALELGWTIIDKVDDIPESSDYILIGFTFSVLLCLTPVMFRIYHLKEFPNFEFVAILSKVWCYLMHNSWRVNLIMVNGIIQRFWLSSVFFFLLSVADRTFKQRLLYAKHFCYLTSSRRAKKFDMPHFRLNKVRNIKTWLSVRSYLKKRGPQRSVDVIVSASFLITIVLITLMCLQLLKDTDTYGDFLCNWELLFWSMTLGVYLFRFLTLGLKINKKYRNLSVLITEQINLYLQMEQKPHKKEELMVANNVLKLAEDLLKELESPFKVSGITANPVIYNITRVVVLSAFSAVLTELLGFKLKLYKIKLKA